VAFLESMTETEQEDKQQVHAAYFNQESERGAEREGLLRGECLQVIEDTRTNYQSVLSVLCVALEKLGICIYIYMHIYTYIYIVNIV
jgi:hypothetical protein